MTIIFGAIFLFFVGALIKLLFHGKQNKKLTASKTFTRAQLRILIVTALMIVLFAAIFGFRYSNSNNDAIERTANRSNWVKCKVKADIFGYEYPHECSTEVNPERTSFGPKMFQNVGLAMLGAWVFLGFGTDTSTFRQWLGKCIYKRDMSGFWRRLSISKSSAELISASSIKSRSKKSSEQTSEQQSNELRSINLESSSDVKSNEPTSSD